MRITNNTMVNNYLTALNQSLERQSNIQQNLADQKNIHKPSDDPMKVMRSLRFNSNLQVNKQFTQNIADAQSWMETTDNAMSDMSSIMVKARELVIQATSSNTSDSWKALAESVDGLISHVVTLTNTKIGDRYVFAGQMDKTEPLQQQGDTFSYLGDDNKISMIIKPGDVTVTQDSVNITGKDVLGSGLELLNHLAEIKNQLKSGNPSMTWLSNTGLDYIQQDHDRMLQQHTQLGSRMSMYDLAREMISDNNTVITNDLANNEDLDVPKAIMEFKKAENIYTSALSVGAKVLPASLVDFLR